MNAPLYTFIIPVYDRPDELAENLASLKALINKDFEVIIIEDGSTLRSDTLVEKYQQHLNIRYYFKENEGPSIGRNVGAQEARGTYLIFVDSDCIIPPEYLDVVNAALNPDTDVFGGPDKAHESFTSLQKAINFSMTSLLTTGGIRGSKKSVDRYYPRSFNLGIKRDVFLKMGGFPLTKMHPGEDMVFGIELIKRGYKTQYIHDAYVYHKRRTSMKQFFHQIRKFGKVRYYITRMYPDTFRITYLLPIGFVLFCLCVIVTWLMGWNILIYILLGYSAAIFISSTIENRSLNTGLMSVMTSLVQFWAYAIGIVSSAVRHWITGKDEYDIIGKKLFND
ncbi:MAG: glycosyltransferase involved in cell wall biosynthesis [Saprospiraceae bacterium]